MCRFYNTVDCAPWKNLPLHCGKLCSLLIGKITHPFLIFKVFPKKAVCVKVLELTDFHNNKILTLTSVHNKNTYIVTSAVICLVLGQL